MINHIDLSSVLRRTVCDLYSDLVTRPTGAAVRLGIEQQLAALAEPTLTVIDFSHVGLLDFSCADEIVAKLLLRYTAQSVGGNEAMAAPRDAYFVFRGLHESHLDAIECVLDRHGLAIVAQSADGGVTLVGSIGDEERRAWEALCRIGRCAAAELSRVAGFAPQRSEAVLGALARRKLVMMFDERYVAVGATT